LTIRIVLLTQLYIYRLTEIPLVLRYHCDSTGQYTKCAFLTIRIVLLARMIIDILWWMV